MPYGIALITSDDCGACTRFKHSLLPSLEKAIRAENIPYKHYNIRSRGDLSEIPAASRSVIKHFPFIIYVSFDTAIEDGKPVAVFNFSNEPSATNVITEYKRIAGAAVVATPRPPTSPYSSARLVPTASSCNSGICIHPRFSRDSGYDRK